MICSSVVLPSWCAGVGESVCRRICLSRRWSVLRCWSDVQWTTAWLCPVSFIHVWHYSPRRMHSWTLNRLRLKSSFLFFVFLHFSRSFNYSRSFLPLHSCPYRTFPSVWIWCVRIEERAFHENNFQVWLCLCSHFLFLLFLKNELPAWDGRILRWICSAKSHEFAMTIKRRVEIHG